MRLATNRPDRRRRGFTMIEMLVVVALLVLMMTILVSIFASATGAISVARANTELDASLRMLEGTLRRDLDGATARFTPPLDRKDNLGYFEYGENAFADLQGEDTDDYIAFTAKAPEGQPFTGRVMILVPSSGGNPAGFQMVPVTSDYAEIIYFLRGDKLYRRVLLVAPERAKSLFIGNFGLGAQFTFNGIVYSWQGLNDISARPQVSPSGGVATIPRPNTLGDLTNREYRRFSPRFVDDFVNNTSGAGQPDGYTDDVAGGGPNGVPDYYPTLYPLLWNTTLVNTAVAPMPAYSSYDQMPFPYIYPYAYSKPDPLTLAYGAIHSLDPQNVTYNHAPIETGDSLAVPDPANNKGVYQSWFGFPTWKETMSPMWIDPFFAPNTNSGLQTPGLSRVSNAPIYPLPLRTRLTPFGTLPASYAVAPFADGVGSATQPNTFDFYWNQVRFAGRTDVDPDSIWEDDLIMSGVRSFDIKALDPNARVYNPVATTFVPLGAGYFDLGYQAFYFPYTAGGANFYMSHWTPRGLLPTFAHEGRIPPLLGAGNAPNDGDNRPDYHYPQLSPNVGDDQAGVIRLRRVWDSWSYDYARAWDSPLVNPLLGPPYAPPVYPSYPPPYEQPLRGLQIQIRVVDPTSQYIKTLTIRQDFSDKL